MGFKSEDALFNIEARRESSRAVAQELRRSDARTHRIIVHLIHEMELRAQRAKVVEAEDRAAKLATRLSLPEQRIKQEPMHPPARRRRGFIDVLRDAFGRPRWEREMLDVQEPVKPKDRSMIEFEYALATREVEVYREQLIRLENEWAESTHRVGQASARAIEGKAQEVLAGGSEIPRLPKIEGPFR